MECWLLVSTRKWGPVLGNEEKMKNLVRDVTKTLESYGVVTNQSVAGSARTTMVVRLDGKRNDKSTTDVYLTIEHIERINAIGSDTPASTMVSPRKRVSIRDVSLAKVREALIAHRELGLTPEQFKLALGFKITDDITDLLKDLKAKNLIKGPQKIGVVIWTGEDATLVPREKR